MKRIVLTALASLAVVLLVVSAALAHAPSVQITSVGGQDATSGSVGLSTGALPMTVDIEGTMTHENPGNVNPVKLELIDNGTSIYYGSPFSDLGNIGTAGFTVPWTITDAGNHTIEAIVSHGNADGTDTIDVNLVLNVEVTQCPAAPSIAAHYLREMGVKSGSKMFTNIISLVADHMGPTTYFDGVGACDPGYVAAVESFVDGLVTTPVSK